MTRALLVAAVWALPLVAQSTLIPVADRRDHVWDASRDVLWITRDNGTVQAYDPYADRLLAPIPVGIAPRGADITTRGTTLYVADNVPGVLRGYVRQVDLATGAVTTLAYDLEITEGGAWDIALVGGGKALVTTRATGNEHPPLRELNLATGVFTRRNDAGLAGLVRGGTMLARNFARNLIAVVEPNDGSGPAFTYRPAGDQFSPRTSTQGVLLHAAVHPLATRIAIQERTQICVFDENLAPVRTLAHDGGVAFAANGFLWAVAGARLLAYDPTIWSVEADLPLGETAGPATPFGEGVITVSDDDAFLFVSTASGIRVFVIGFPRPAPLQVSPANVPHGQPAAVTVRGRFFRGPGLEVRFGGVLASDIVLVDPQTITCTAPAGAPGPVDVEVRTATAGGVLAAGLRYTPALLLEGDPRPGGHVVARHLLAPGRNAVGFLGALAPSGLPIGGFDGVFCLREPIGYLVAIAHPFEELAVQLPIPPDPALRGQSAWFQGLIGTLADGSGAFTNCARWEIR
jgi:hypothetical protein